MKKKLSILMAIGVMAVSIAGCGGTKPSVEAPKDPATTQETPAKTEDAAAPAAPKAGGTLVMGEFVTDQQMAAVNPFLPDNTSDEVLRLMYEHLMYFNPVSGEVEPELATEFAWSADFKELTYTIRDGVKWHDGKPVTAEDVAYTYNALKAEPVLDRYNLWSKLESVTATGNKVVFKLSKVFPSFTYYTTDVYIVPKHIFEAGGEVAKNINSKPIGSGPFMFSAYKTGTDIQFAAFKDYWRAAPKLDKLVMLMYNSSPNLTLALLKGDISGTMNTIAMSSVPEFKTKEGAQMQVYPGIRNYAVMMNHEVPGLNDINVRKAMAMAINQGDLITKAEYNGVFPVSAGWLPEYFGELHNKAAKESLKYDVAAATALLESSGYTKGKDGIYQKDGVRLSFTYTNQSGAPAQQMEAGMIQQWLLNVGVEIIPRLATAPELVQLMQMGDYQLLQSNIKYPPDPYAALNTSFNSAMTAPTGTATPGTNYFRYKNPELDKVLDQVAVETDPVKQKELYHKAQELIANDSVFLPMYNLGAHAPYYKDVKYSGWIDKAPIFSTQGIIEIYEK